jgi:hypothetical protein
MRDATFFALRDGRISRLREIIDTFDLSSRCSNAISARCLMGERCA